MTSKSEARRATLKKKFASGDMIIGPGVYDGLSARIADTQGFDALYLTGYGVSASLLTKPDNGFLSADDMQFRIASLCEEVKTPIIADADTGFGDIADTVARYEVAGAAGIQLEDQQVPKICGHIAGREVIAREEAIANIQQAVAARKSDDFLIVARTDAREQNGLDEAIARGAAFLEAGADVLFIESPESAEEMATIGKELGHASLLANMIEGGRTPLMPREELMAMGFNFIIYPVVALAVVTASLQETYRQLLRADVAQERVTFKELSRMVGLPEKK